jgi:hypothetical protein
MGNADDQPGRDRASTLRHGVGTAENQTGAQLGHGAVLTVAARDLHEGWLLEPAYRAAYQALDGEFAQAESLMQAGARADPPQTGLNQ